MKKSHNRYKYRWIIHVTIITFVFSFLLNSVSKTLLDNIGLVFGFLLLLLIIFIGIIFDIIGIAVATADRKPFNSMASRKINGAREALELINHAGPVSNFCNDVVGDIAGIVSGSTITVLILRIGSITTFFNTSILGVALISLTASLTVGGKAFGKEMAIYQSKEIVFKVGRIIHFFNNKITFKRK
jgi:CBS domain containing-hemolysin-like protein